MNNLQGALDENCDLGWFGAKWYAPDVEK